MNEVLEGELGKFLDLHRHDEAFQCAMAGYGPEVRGYLARILDSYEDAEEAFSQTWEWIWRGLPTFRRSCSFRTWAYRIASHAASRVRRSHKRTTPIDSSLETRLAAPNPSSLPRHAKSEEKGNLLRARAMLSHEDQELLVLRVDRALSWREIAWIVSTEEAPVTPGALRNRFARLKASLKQLLRDGTTHRAPQ